MTTILFIIGLLTCIGCGLNVMKSEGSALHELAWVIGGGIGAAMMIAAIYFGGGA